MTAQHRLGERALEVVRAVSTTMWRRHSPETTSGYSCGLFFRLNNLQAELLSTLQHGANLLFAMAGRIVDGPLIHVLLAFRQEPIEQAG